MTLQQVRTCKTTTTMENVPTQLDRAFKKKTTDPSADSIINSNKDQGHTTDAKLYMAGTDKVFLCNGLYKQINQLPF